MGLLEGPLHIAGARKGKKVGEATPDTGPGNPLQARPPDCDDAPCGPQLENLPGQGRQEGRRGGRFRKPGRVLRRLTPTRCHGGRLAAAPPARESDL